MVFRGCGNHQTDETSDDIEQERLPVELRATQLKEIATLREMRRRGLPLGLVPAFYDRLVRESLPYVLWEEPEGGEGGRTLGYALVLETPHDGHTHATVLEVHLIPGQEGRYEEALDLLRRESPPPPIWPAPTIVCTRYLLSRGCMWSDGFVLRADGRRARPGDRGPSGDLHLSCGPSMQTAFLH